jgi:UDP-3-O-[3-hydroxymyristoyl] glucosamine N-acyltransferase
MQLSDIASIVPVEVIRNRAFSNLGLLSHRGEGVLAGFYDPHFAPAMHANPDLSCVITTRELAPEVPGHIAIALADDVKAAFYGLHEHLHRATDFYWQEFPTEIAADAQVHETAYVAPKNVRIGSGCVIGPRAIILEKCILGSNVTVLSGAMVGGEGFEPKWVGGRHLNIPHAGGVKIDDGAQVLCGAHIARAVFRGFTEIGAGSIVDALVHVAHNARIGKNCEIAANTVIAGTTNIGDEVWIGPNACVSSEVKIGDHSFVSLGSVLIHSIPEQSRVSGYFAFDHKKYKRAWKRFSEVD